MFVFGQPHRYFANPMFQLKFTLRAPAIPLTVVVHRIELGDGPFARSLAAVEGERLEGPAVIQPAVIQIDRLAAACYESPALSGSEWARWRLGRPD
jgi:hypothetical protein